HETSPWHYLGGERAARRYQHRHGRPPKNRYGASLYPVSVSAALAWARLAQGAVLVDAVPRYLPGWTRPLLPVPVLRELLTWNRVRARGRAGAPGWPAGPRAGSGASAPASSGWSPRRRTSTIPEISATRPTSTAISGP